MVSIWGMTFSKIFKMLRHAFNRKKLDVSCTNQYLEYHGDGTESIRLRQKVNF